MTALADLPIHAREGLAAWYVLAGVYPSEWLAIGPATRAEDKAFGMFILLKGTGAAWYLHPMTAEDAEAWYAANGPGSFSEAMVAWNAAPVEERVAMVDARAIRLNAAILLATFVARCPPPRPVEAVKGAEA